MAGAFFVGVGIRSIVPIDRYVAFSVLAAAAAIVALSRARQFHAGLYCALALCTALAGIVRTEYAVTAYTRALLLPEGVRIERNATVVAEPDLRETHSVLTLELDRTGNEPPITVRAPVPRYPVFTYGDRINVRGVVARPLSFVTGTGRTFDYPGYLMKDGVHYELRHADARPLNVHAGTGVVRMLFAIKQTWLDALSRTLREPDASLVGGVVVGAKQSLGEEWLTLFRTTGVVHIVVLSGFNLTLVALFIVWLTRRLPRTVRLGAGILGIIAFALVTGAGATVIRASIMACCALVAQFLARPYAITRALVVAACAMVLINPFVLVFDPGFQLSFLATLGLIYITPLIEGKLLIVPTVLGLRAIIAATLGTQSAVLPLLAYQVGQASLVAPIVNLLVLPVIPALMALGFATGTLGIASSILATPVAWMTHLLSAYVFGTVHLFASIPYAAVSLPPMPVSLMIGIYLLGIMFMWRVYTKRPPARMS